MDKRERQEPGDFTEMKITIKGVELELDGKIIILPIEDAHKLMGDLKRLFGERNLPAQPIIVPVIVERDRWPWSPYTYPMVTYEEKGTGVYPQIQQPFTTCLASGCN